MDTATLRWFVAVAEGTTLSETADAFHISQPAITRSFQRLGDELGAPVLERSGRRVRPTYAGTILLGAARRILAELDEATRAVTEASDPAAGTVRLGFLSPLGTWLIPELLIAFRAERPHVRFELRSDGVTRILQALTDGALDLLLSADPETVALRWEPLLDEELVLAVPAGHVLAGRRRVAPAALAEEAWVLLPPGYGLRRRAEELCEAAGFQPRIAFEGHDLASLFALIAAGSGIGLFPVKPTPPEGICQVRLSPPEYRAVGLVSVPGAVRPPSADAFAEVVRGYLRGAPGDGGEKDR